MRFIPLTEKDRKEMLATIGVNHVDDLFADIPAEAKLDRPLNIPGPLPERELLNNFGLLASMNKPVSGERSFLGAGAYSHHVPVAVDQMLLRGEFFTAYTPYQPEVSQGTLMAIYEFQTYTSALLGMDIANASMYDGASSLAEAVIMAKRVKKKNRVVISGLVDPAWRKVVETYVQDLDIDIVVVDGVNEGVTNIEELSIAAKDSSAIVIQYPNFVGCIDDLNEVRRVCDEAGALMIVATSEPVAMGVMTSPGKLGADIAVAEGRSFGGSLSYGGPGLGMFATKQKWARQIPGRLVGKTNDVDGKPGYVLTLATREQHIRREKATSNICSNQALCATAAAIHLSLLGKNGLQEMALKNMTATKYLAEKISALNGFELAYKKPFFNEVAIKVPAPAETINKKLAKNGFVGGFDLSKDFPSLGDSMLFCATELHTKNDIDALATALSGFKV